MQKIFSIFSLFLFIACNPKPSIPATVTGNDEPTTTNSQKMDVPLEKCIECKELKDCSTFGHICDLDSSICLQVCEENDQSACFGHPELCIPHKTGIFICKSDCIK